MSGFLWGVAAVLVQTCLNTPPPTGRKATILEGEQQ